MPEISDIAKRVRSLREREGLSQPAFGDKVGWSAAQVSRVENGKRDIKAHDIRKLSRAFHVSHEWLLFGETADRAAEVEDPYAALTDDKLIEELERRLKQDASRDVVFVGDRGSDEQYTALPYMEGEAAAGSGSVVEDYVRGYVVVHKRAIPPGSEVVAVTVHGNSMEPALPDGSIVAIDTSRMNPAELQGKIVAARTADNDVVIKRLSAVKRCLILTSDNDQVAPEERIIEVDPREVEKPIIGQVVWAWTPQAEPYKI